MLIPLHWLSTAAAFGLLLGGGLLLTALLACFFRPGLGHPKTFTVLGLFVVAAALDVLKDRTAPWSTGGEFHFRVVRNLLSLTLLGVPIALVLLRARSTARLTALLLGTGGAFLVTLAALGFVESFQHGRESWIAAARLPGAWVLQVDGNMASARFLLGLGGVFLATPLFAKALRHWNPERPVPFRPLDGTLLGLGLCSASMAIFFWHQYDDSDRFYTYLFMIGTAWLAPMLALGGGRLVTARWGQQLLSGFGPLLLLWMLSGFGGMEEYRGQWFSDFWLPGLLLVLIALLLPALGLHLLLELALRARGRKS